MVALGVFYNRNDDVPLSLSCSERGFFLLFSLYFVISVKVKQTKLAKLHKNRMSFLYAMKKSNKMKKSFKKTLTNKSESGRITKLSQNSNKKSRSKPSQKFLKEIFKNLLTRRKRSDIIDELT